LNLLKLDSLKARICFNSRGNKTIEVDAETNNFIGRSSTPSGKSKGELEAVEFVDENIDKTLKIFNTYRNEFIGINILNTEKITSKLRQIDNTVGYSKIGGSIAYAISLAIADLGSKICQKPLYELINFTGNYTMPYPLGNIIGGGSHGTSGCPDIQEILVCPIGLNNINNCIDFNFLLHKEIGLELKRRFNDFVGGRNDEGAWINKFNDIEALDLVTSVIDKLIDEYKFKICIGIDFASSSYWDKNKQLYIYKNSQSSRTIEDQCEYVEKLINNYNLFYVEDPFHENDVKSFAELTAKFSNTIIAGDDLFVTNIDRLNSLSESNPCNGAILKVNQIGSLGEAITFAQKCHELNYSIISAHRSGDTIDSHLSHIAVGTQSKLIKTGILGGERVSKLNELIRINDSYDSSNINMANLQIDL